ncbi:beta-ketoacyl synthase N-terminal-like domain-containing protein [Streptomyces sp. FXJ1.172]|uniref:beta-ketoacyl synthase N-terminal-like domain-containing protein n=1 Tax=Streptomyces sp. FXJ1.172 TaxID=710705 RepID=UPI0007CF8998|nr:beta-ketoacyl synthase N-terminal-like domain-containing protein [Streptomyces sp. FXJ1.172]WEO94738.1 beta-ketoacyl synthase N-terminal-like domain-containing protein [Streptomyces sp. FXJ1.172]
MSGTSTARRGPVITGWSAVSPYGIGRDAFVTGTREGRPTATALTREEWDGPDTRAHLVPNFVIKDVLGRKGTRSMDRVTGLAVTAVRELLGEGGGRPESGDNVALVLGTTTGSAQSMMDITRDTLVHEKPFYIDPSHIPNAIMNCPAGQCAIWYGLKGPNTTVAAGRSSGLAALNYARRLLASGRARTVLCGAAEEYSSARSWLEWHTRRPDEGDTVLGEGCAVLRLRPAGTVSEGEGLAEVLAVESGVAGPEGTADALAATVRRALGRAAASTHEVWAVSASAPAGLLGQQEQAGLDAVLGTLPVRRLTQSLGDTAAATGALQLASVLAAAEEDPQARGRVAVVTSADRDGALACAVLRLM